MVFKAGRIAEIDTPQTLLNNKCSLFYSMAKDAGLAEWSLHDMTWHINVFTMYVNF